MADDTSDTSYTTQPDDNTDSVELPEEKRQTLLQFQEIVAIDSEEECLCILERHNWILEVAVQSTFNENEGLPPVYSSQPSVGGQIDADGIIHYPQSITNPIMRQESSSAPGEASVDLYRQDSWLSWLSRVVFFPLTLTHAGYAFCYHSVSGILTLLVRIFIPSFGRGKSQPIDDILKFKKEYEDMYGAVHPTLYLGSYSQVLSDARKELKFILVYLHAKQHQTHQIFVTWFCRTLGLRSILMVTCCFGHVM